MQTKAFFASSVPAALEVARQELGENALLVSSRPSPPEVRQYGRLEVTFAWDPRPVKIAVETEPHSRQAASDMNEIRQQLAALRNALARGGHSAITTIETEASLIAEKLFAAGFSRETAAGLAQGAESRSGNRDSAVLDELASRIAVAPFLAMKPGESRTLAFIGPPGRGKTTSLVKLAVHLGLARRVPVRIYCAGAHCIGGQEQLLRYASILGAPCQTFESLASLNLALNGEGWKGLALIDTPGISSADRSEMAELKSFFAGRPEIEKHLVLRSDANSADMLGMLSRFSVLAPSRLLFTGMDETLHMASVVEALVGGNIPATFSGTGQRIPEDLEEMDSDRLARAVWTDSLVNVEWATRQDRFSQAAA